MKAFVVVAALACVLPSASVAQRYTVYGRPGVSGLYTRIGLGIAECGPPNFNCSTQSTAVATTPTLPTMAAINSTGYAYSSPTNFFYPSSGKGNCFTALTDATSRSGASFSASWSGGGSNVMWDVSRSYISATDGNNMLYAHVHYDANGCVQIDSPWVPSLSGGSGGGGFTMSRVTPATAYRLSAKNGDGSKSGLYQENLAYNSGTSTTTITRTKIFDFNNCPGVDGTQTTQGGNGNLNVDAADNRFSTSLNFPPAAGGQDAAHWILVWDAATNSCSTYYTGELQNVLSPVTPTAVSSTGGLETISGTAFTFAVGDLLCVKGMTPASLNVCGMAQSPTNSTTITLPNAISATGTVMGTVGKTENQWNGNWWTWCSGNCSQHGTNPAPSGFNLTCAQPGYGVHNTAGFHNGLYVGISGNCNPAETNNFQTWEFGTGHVEHCSSNALYNCGGHNAHGWSTTRQTDLNMNIRPASNLSTWTVFHTPPPPVDFHGGANWIGPAADVNPWLASTQNPGAVGGSCTGKYLCFELVAFRLDGQIVRFAPNFYVWPAGAAGGSLGPIPAMSQDGYCMSFQSTWNGTRGVDASGHYRTDLFAICNLQ